MSPAFVIAVRYVNTDAWGATPYAGEVRTEATAVPCLLLVRLDAMAQGILSVKDGLVSSGALVSPWPG